MFNVPTELALSILSYLPIASLSRLHVICKFWNEFCNLHESTIYRNAAYLHAYIPHPTTALNELGSLYSQKALEGVKTWKDLSRRRFQTQRNWKGKGPSVIVEHKSTSPEWTDMVHRIKIDELAGYIMTTSNQGGLLVTDLNKDRILWALPPWYVHQYAHLEYSQGYMIFDRNNGDKEVWRRLSDSDSPEHVVEESSAPDAMQREVYDQTCKSLSFAVDGYFRPWAVLHMPERTSAFRFIYPTLIVAAFDRAYLWDIPSGKLIQTLQGMQYVASEDLYNESLGRVTYVEISERHVFISGQFRLRVFSRATGKSVLNLTSFEGSYGFWTYVPVVSHDRTPGSALERCEMTARKQPYGSGDGLEYRKFVAVHVSACGCHFAALLSTHRLLVVSNFEKVSNDEELYAQTLDVQISPHGMHGSRSIYLAFDYGRISAVTTMGVFIFELDESTLANISTEAPTLTMCRVFQLADELSLGAVTCLMISDTGLYLNWNASTLSASEDDENLESELENDQVFPNDNLTITLPPTGLCLLILMKNDNDGYVGVIGNTEPPEPPQASLSSVFSVNFACY